jgi:hypothetical protein
MSIALWQEVKALKRQVEELKNAPKVGSFERLEKLEEEIKQMKNQYKMLNARISRKHE